MYYDLITILQRRGHILPIFRHLRHRWPWTSLRGHPRSILVPIESAHMTSYWSSIVTLVLSCRVSEILELLCAESRFFDTLPYSGQNLRVFPLEKVPDVRVCGERRPQAN